MGITRLASARHEPDRIKIGLLGLMIELYERLGDDLRRKQDGFARELASSWDWAEVVWPGVANTRAKVESAVRRFQAEGCDAIVVVCLTYAPSLISARALKKTPLPVIILDTQPDPGPGGEPAPEFLMRNHGVHGVQDLANVLLRAARPVAIVVGDWRSEETVGALKESCLAARGRSILSELRVGLVGRAMAGMGDLTLDETAFALDVGPEVVPVAPGRIARLAEEADSKEVKRRVAEDGETFDIAPELEPAEHEAATRVSLALERIVEEEGLGAMAVYFLAVSEDGRVPTLPFLGASRLLAEGFGYAGEGDVACASLVAALQHIAPPATFTEMFSMDFTDGSLVMQHMGEGNYAMSRGDRKPLLVKRAFKLAPTPFAPATPCFSLAPGPATIGALFPGPEGGFRLVVSEGEVLDWGPFKKLGTPHFKFAPDAGLRDFVRAWSDVGGSHHQALCRGHRAGLLAGLGAAVGVETVLI